MAIEDDSFPKVDADRFKGVSPSDGSNGQFLQTTGSDIQWAAAGGKFEDALSNGKVLADDGNLYSSIQTAENNATDWMFIGKGTFSEQLSIGTAGLTVYGAGKDSTTIKPSGSTAIVINADNVTLKDLNPVGDANGPTRALETGASAGNYWVENCHLESDAGYVIYLNSGNGVANFINCEINQAGSSNGLYITSGDLLRVKNCYIHNAQFGLNAGIQAIIEGNYIDVTDTTIVLGGDDSICKNNICYAGGDGIRANGNDQVVGANWVNGSGSFDGIAVNATNQIIFNNRISSFGTHINTAGATTPTTDANVTGALT